MLENHQVNRIMDGIMDDIVKRLLALKQAWQEIDNLPDDLASIGLPGRSSRFVEESIHELACIAQSLASAPSESMVMVRSSCEFHLKPMESFFFQDISDHPSMQTLAFVTLLKEMQTTLREAVAEERPQPIDE